MSTSKMCEFWKGKSRRFRHIIMVFGGCGEVEQQPALTYNPDRNPETENHLMVSNSKARTLAALILNLALIAM